MNLKHLNLERYNIPENVDIQVPVFLIASDLKIRKLVNTLTSIGCDNCFCVPDLCELILPMVGFKDRPNELYGFYFDLLDQYCENVTDTNDFPINEALSIYKQLVERQRQLN